MNIRSLSIFYENISDDLFRVPPPTLLQRVLCFPPHSAELRPRVARHQITRLWRWKEEQSRRKWKRIRVGRGETTKERLKRVGELRNNNKNVWRREHILLCSAVPSEKFLKKLVLVMTWVLAKILSSYCTFSDCR